MERRSMMRPGDSEWRGAAGLSGASCEESDVDLLGEVVAELVEAIDVVLDVDDGGVGGVGVAGFVFAVPEIVVGAMLVEDELVEGFGWRRELARTGRDRARWIDREGRRCGRRRAWEVIARITEARRRW